MTCTVRLTRWQVELVGIRVTGPSTVEADWRMGGWLRSEYFPWGAKVEPFEGEEAGMRAVHEGAMHGGPPGRPRPC